MTITLRHLTATICLIVCIIFLPGSSVMKTDKAIQWQRWEHTFQSRHDHRDKDAVINVIFTGPSGSTFESHMFTDDGKIFHITAAFPTPGTWRWKTTCSVPGYEDLNKRRGKVAVEAYSGENPLYRHGDLRISDDKRYLIHADGTPFLWMGETGWNATLKSTMREWRDYVDQRAAQRFSVIQLSPRGASNKFTMPASESVGFNKEGLPDLAFWQDLEGKIAYANEQGLMVFLVGVGKSWRDQFAENTRNPPFELYLTGRLAGDMVIFSPSFDQLFDPGNDSVAVELNKYSTHLVTQHPGTNYEANLKYRDAPSTDFAGLQSGHHRGNLTQAYHAARSWTMDMWNGVPVKPVIDIEAMYDAYGSNDGKNWREKDARKLGWIAWLSGSRGYTYGAGDVPPKVPGGAGGVWRFEKDSSAYDYWRKAIMWPSAGQMSTMRSFLESIEWWQLVPAPALIRNQTDDETLKMSASTSAEDGGLVLAYLPDNPFIQLNLGSFQRKLKGKWFNPVTGESVPIDRPVLPASEVSFSRPEGWEDAVLVLTTSR